MRTRSRSDARHAPVQPACSQGGARLRRRSGRLRSDSQSGGWTDNGSGGIGVRGSGSGGASSSSSSGNSGSGSSGSGSSGSGQSQPDFSSTAAASERASSPARMFARTTGVQLGFLLKSA